MEQARYWGTVRGRRWEKKVRVERNIVKMTLRLFPPSPNPTPHCHCTWAATMIHSPVETFLEIPDVLLNMFGFLFLLLLSALFLYFSFWTVLCFFVSFLGCYVKFSMCLIVWFAFFLFSSTLLRSCLLFPPLLSLSSPLLCSSYLCLLILSVLSSIWLSFLGSLSSFRWSTSLLKLELFHPNHRPLLL